MSRVVRSAFAIADKVARVSPSASAATRALVIWTMLAAPSGVALILAPKGGSLLSPGSLAVLIGCIGMVGAILHLRSTQKVSESSQILTLSVLIGLGMTAWLTDVPDLLPLIFLAVTPVYFGLMVSWRKCLIYAIGLSAFLLALAAWVFVAKSAPLDVVINIVGCAFAAIGAGISTTAYSYTTDLAAKKLRRQNTEIVTLAYKDAMTGIENRRAFNEYLNQPCEGETDYIMAAVDLNDFKAINDRYGHEVGDEVLAQLADRLKTASPADASVYRVGGDEFAIIATDVSNASEALAIDLCAVSEEPYETSAGQLAIKISVGLSSDQDKSNDLKQLYREADIALFEAKKAEANDWCLYSENLGAAKNREARLTELLRSAIRAEEINVAYQPQYNIADKMITGFEALARWQPNEFGPVSPGEFVPIADQAALIVGLDRCVFKHAVTAAQSWLRSHQKLAVNVSGKTLLSDDFVAYAKQVITTSGLEFNQLTIEITETELIDNQKDAKRICDDLRALGIAIALDDFGTGYSSLSYLSTLPINTLKIDRSFVQSAETQSNVKIMRSIVGLADSLGLNLLVEGVERNWQLETVINLGCERVQGFYFSRPLTSEQCAALLKREAPNLDRPDLPDYAQVAEA